MLRLHRKTAVKQNQISIHAVKKIIAITIHKTAKKTTNHAMTTVARSV